MGNAWPLVGVLAISFVGSCAEAPAPPASSPLEGRSEAARPTPSEPAPPPEQAQSEPGTVCTGTVTAEDGERLKQGASQTKQCYDELLQRNQCAASRLQVLTQFEASGSASMSIADGLGFVDARFYACVEAVMAKVRIGKQASCVRVVVPLNFVPTEPPPGCIATLPQATFLPTPTGTCPADELVWLQPATTPSLFAPCSLGDVATCQEACDREGTAACLILATTYAEGHGVAQDSARAIAVLERSCSVGYQTACGFLAAFLAQGNLGVPIDTARAEELALTACRAGRPSACEALSYLYFEKGDTGAKECATRLLQASCDADLMSACSRLAATLTETDLDAASKLFEKACGKGYEPACVRLAQTQLAGGDPARQQQALANLTTRCNSDSYDACNALGYAFVRGSGVPQDPARGVELFRKACVQQYPNGCDSLAEAYVNGWGVKADRAIANEYYSKACSWGHGPACPRVVGTKKPK